MSSQEQVFDDDVLDNALPLLGWIVLAAMAAVTAFLLAPL